MVAHPKRRVSRLSGNVKQTILEGGYLESDPRTVVQKVRDLQTSDIEPPQCNPFLKLASIHLTASPRNVAYMEASSAREVATADPPKPARMEPYTIDAGPPFAKAN